jgi:DNA-3-methyladenine glycosylase II
MIIPAGSARTTILRRGMNPLADPAGAIRHLRKVDRALAPILQRVGAFNMNRVRHRFSALVWSIISQQISIKAAAAIRQRLADRLRTRRLTPEAVRALSLEELRACGLSTPKARYLHGLADGVSARTVKLRSIHRRDDEGVIAELVQVKGIGRWTAEMFLIFCLGRLDVLPVDDLGLRVAIQKLDALAELPTRAFVLERGAIWQPYRSVATWYLWQSLK